MKPSIPNQEQCEEVLASMNVPEHIIKHSQVVHYAAMRIGRDLKWLRDRGPNLALISAAALLHDIAKGGPDHARAGAESLRKLGYNAVADIVEVHNNLEYSGEFPVTEKEIVFIADKMVIADQMVTVAYNYTQKMEKCKNDLKAVAEIERRKEIAMRIKTSIEQETQKNLEELAIAEG